MTPPPWRAASPKRPRRVPNALQTTKLSPGPLARALFGDASLSATEVPGFISKHKSAFYTGVGEGVGLQQKVQLTPAAEKFYTKPEVTLSELYSGAARRFAT